MLPGQFDQVDQIPRRSLAAGFLLHGFQNGEAKGIGKVGKAVVKGNHFPAGEVRECILTVLLELLQLFQKSWQVFFKNGAIIRVAGGETRADIPGHLLGQNRGKPDVGVMLVAVVMLVFFLVLPAAEKLDAL